jgi:Tol biopolymer transport system component/actin-like ATPase involved in cell morphogenesis
MTYALGIDVGTTFSAAAIWRDGRAETVPLGNRANAVPSVVFLRDDGTLMVGDAAARRAVAEPHRVAREFKRRVGDRVPVMLGEHRFEAQQLLAAMVAWIVERVAEREDAPPDYVTLTCPANWGEYRRELLRQAAQDAGLSNAGIIEEPVAAAIYYASQERVDPGAYIGVYDLGGGTFDATVLRKTAEGFEVQGTPEGDDRLGGVDFDQAVLAHVAASLGERWAQLDLTDMATLRGVAQVRANAVEAKEALSTDVDAGVAVILPGMTEDVRLTRSEFEGAIRLPLQRTVEVFRQAVIGAGIAPSQLYRVLLVGGSSRIPLVSQLLMQQLGVQVAVDAHPKYAVCLGAAVAAGTRLAASEQVSTHGAQAPRAETQEFATIVGDDASGAQPDDTEAVEVNLVARGLTVPLDHAIDEATEPLAAGAAETEADAETATDAEVGAEATVPEAAADATEPSEADTTKRLDADATEPVLAASGSSPPRRRIPPAYAIMALVVLVAGGAMWLYISTRPDNSSSGGGGGRLVISTPSPAVSASPTSEPPQDEPDLIAFVSDRSGSPELWTMNADGSDPRQITDGQADELVHPDWSPDGQRIVFASNTTEGNNGDGDVEIWTVNADGTDLQQLTDNVGIRDAAPDWSPDGARIAFSSQRTDTDAGGGDLDIWTINSIDGQDAQQLTDNDHDDDTPDWSPDGQQIVWETSVRGNLDIYRMNADGSEKVEVIAGPGEDAWPMWSPDGDAIAYHANDASAGLGWDIYTATAQGGSIERLTSDESENHRPNWSPDGDQLTFDKPVGEALDIFLIPAAGGEAQPLTDDPAADHSAAWRPAITQ